MVCPLGRDSVSSAWNSNFCLCLEFVGGSPHHFTEEAWMSSQGLCSLSEGFSCLPKLYLFGFSSVLNPTMYTWDILYVGDLIIQSVWYVDLGLHALFQWR